jgi:hypothetical protein
MIKPIINTVICWKKFDYFKFECSLPVTNSRWKVFPLSLYLLSEYKGDFAILGDDGYEAIMKLILRNVTAQVKISKVQDERCC